jgi:hypothetical protein
VRCEPKKSFFSIFFVPRAAAADERRPPEASIYSPGPKFGTCESDLSPLHGRAEYSPIRLVFAAFFDNDFSKNTKKIAPRKRSRLSADIFSPLATTTRRPVSDAAVDVGLASDPSVFPTPRFKFGVANLSEYALGVDAPRQTPRCFHFHDSFPILTDPALRDFPAPGSPRCPSQL